MCLSPDHRTGHHVSHHTGAVWRRKRSATRQRNADRRIRQLHSKHDAEFDRLLDHCARYFGLVVFLVKSMSNDLFSLLCRCQIKSDRDVNPNVLPLSELTLHDANLACFNQQLVHELSSAL